MNAARPKASPLAVIVDQGPGAARAHPYLAATAATIGALAISALVNRHLAQKAVRDNPPVGQFLEINGVRLHYIERRACEPLVLFHGNGSMMQDFESSGLVDLAAKNHRVIVSTVPALATVIGPVM